MVSVRRHLYVGNNLLLVHSLPLTTLQCYDKCEVFPADIFVMEKVAKFSITEKVAETLHYIKLGLLLETHLKPTYEAPPQRHWSISKAWVYEIWTLVFLCPIYIPLALQ